MNRYFLIPALAFLAFSARAENADSEINVVIFAPKPQAESAAARLPSCNDPAMLKAVAEKVKEYQDENPASSVISRRKQALIVKNLKEFEEIPAAEFDNASNYEVARELVMTKINYRIAEDNLRLCRGGAVSGIYLLMYPEGSGTRVQILNFVPAPDSGNEFSIYFEPPADGETLTEEKASEPARTPDADTASGQEPDGASAAAENAAEPKELPAGDASAAAEK